MATNVVKNLDIESLGKLAGVEAVVLDLDDVLFDKGEWIMHSLEYAVDRMGLDGQRAWELAVEFREAQGKVDHNIYNFILAGLGQSDSGRNIKAMCEQARQYRPVMGQIQLYPGVRGALDELKGNYKLGLVTDGPVLSQRAKVKALDLEKTFQHIVYSDSIAGAESRRPDPRPFEQMWLTLESRKENVLIVGCNPRKDFEKRRDSGFLTLRVLTGEYATLDYQDDGQRADFCLPTVAQLPGLLEEARNVPVPEEHKEDTTLRIA